MRLPATLCPPAPHLWRVAGLCALALGGAGSLAGEASDEFDRQRFKDSLAHELAFREAAMHVAWGAEPLCDDTTEIEPFVLWSVGSVRSGLSAHQRLLFKQATGMDDKWRVAWLDEGAPDTLKLGDAVLAVNDLALPAVSSKVEMVALLRGGSALSVDDQAFWAVMHKAREQAGQDSSMTLTMEGGAKLKVSTQTGCSGAVMASAFDNEPENLLRPGGGRVKLPGNALFAARSRDEYRWLAAFGTYFLSSASSITGQHKADNMGNAFTVGKVLTLALPGAGAALSAMQAQATRAITVDGLVGNADLFANEVVLALGGDPAAGLGLSDRLQRNGIKADVLVMSEFRRSNVEIHLQQLKELARIRVVAEKAAEKAAEQEERAQGEPAAAPATK